MWIILTHKLVCTAFPAFIAWISVRCEPQMEASEYEHSNESHYRDLHETAVKGKKQKQIRR